MEQVTPIGEKTSIGLPSPGKCGDVHKRSFDILREEKFFRPQVGRPKTASFNRRAFRRFWMLNLGLKNFLAKCLGGALDIPTLSG